MSSRETAVLTADVVLLAFGEDGRPHVLLIQRRKNPFADRWALPGGHVDEGEETADAARRELVEETGLDVGELTYVGVYATPGRDPRGRYVTFAYTAILDGPPLSPTAGDDAAKARWWPIRDTPPLAFDHHQIVGDAIAAEPTRWEVVF